MSSPIKYSTNAYFKACSNFTKTNELLSNPLNIHNNEQVTGFPLIKMVTLVIHILSLILPVFPIFQATIENVYYHCLYHTSCVCPRVFLFIKNSLFAYLISVCAYIRHQEILSETANRILIRLELVMMN